MRRFALACALVLIAGACSGDSSDPPTTTTTLPVAEQSSAETTTTAEVVDHSADIAMAIEMIETWEGQDTDAFFAYFGDGATYNFMEQWPFDAETTRDYLSFYMGLHDVVTVDGCAPSSVPGRIWCEATWVDDLSGPAGVTTSGQWVFDFVDGKPMAFDHLLDEFDKIVFIEDVAAWIRDTKPDVWETTFVDPDCSPARVDCFGTWSANADTAAAMLEYGEEYRASLGA